MNNVISKIGIPVAVDSKNKFHLPMTCFTTGSFFAPRVCYCHETVPGESWHNEVKVFCRLSPLIKPLVADITVKTRYFFVPYRVIFKNWNYFLSQSPACGQEETDYIPTVPRVSDRSFSVALSDTKYSSSVPESSQDFDFLTVQGNKRKFNKRGKTIYSILIGLGYQFQFNSQTDHYFSALPLLAYYRVWRDWYKSSQFDDSYQTDKYFFPPFDRGSRSLISSDLQEIFLLISKIYFEKDYFTSASVNPVGPSSRSAEGAYNFGDITVNNQDFDSQVKNTVSPNGTPVLVSNQGNAFSKYSIDLLNSLTDLVKRHDLAGIQPFNRILAQYGVALSDEQLNYSTYIGESVSNIDIADVMSTGYADHTVLGDYAGKGIGFSSKNIKFHTNEFGLILGIMSIVPKFVYSKGYNRLTRHINRFDFFTPEIEHVGVQPIERGEYYNHVMTEDDVTLEPFSIYGYTSRYAEYKTVSRDIVSGNFILPSTKQTYRGWFLERRIDPTYLDDVTLSEYSIVADSAKLNNPFVTDQQILTDDAFNLFVRNDVNAILPMHRMFDDYQFSNAIDNPKDVSIDVHGVQKT